MEGPASTEPSALEAAALGEYYELESTPATEPIACLQLRSIAREAITVLKWDQPPSPTDWTQFAYEVSQYLLSDRARLEDREYLGSQPAYKLDPYSFRMAAFGSSKTSLWVVLDSLRGVIVWHQEGREAEAAALVDLIDLAPLDTGAGTDVLFAIRPGEYVTLPSGDTLQVGIADFVSSPLLGAGERTDDAVEVIGERVRFWLPVPEGWSVWNRHGQECEPEYVALSRDQPIDPCASLIRPPPGAVLLFSGPTEGPSVVLEQAARSSSVSLFDVGFPLDYLDRGQINSADLDNAEAALSFSFSLGESVYQALVLAHQAVGSYGLLAVSPTDQAEEAKRLLWHTAENLRAHSQPQTYQ